MIPLCVDQRIFFVPRPYAMKKPFRYIDNHNDANFILYPIQSGRIGLDTEYSPRQVPKEEKAVPRRQRLAVQRARVARSGAAGVPFDRDGGLCIVQVALDEYVLIMNLKKMSIMPDQLKCIIESKGILKVGTGFINDAKAFWESLGWSPRSLVEIGHMIRLAFPERYAEMAGPVSLETLVQDLLGLPLDKGPQRSQWDLISEASGLEIEYAGLDAQASLECYDLLAAPTGPLQTKARSLQRYIPDDWYTFHWVDGEPVRIEPDYLGRPCPWNYTVCPCSPARDGFDALMRQTLSRASGECRNSPCAGASKERNMGLVRMGVDVARGAGPAEDD
ncbi:ribonuclease H-like domain-containing protein [Mycena galericulata]|nr:ribonuclease H-like domain-containing protein [Mycena galericulata]